MGRQACDTGTGLVGLQYLAAFQGNVLVHGVDGVLHLDALVRGDGAKEAVVRRREAEVLRQWGRRRWSVAASLRPRLRTLGQIGL